MPVRRLIALVALLLLVPAAPVQAAPSIPAPVACTSCWHPPVHTSWDWVLAHPPRAPYRNVRLYDVDGFETSTAQVAALHRAGKKVACYVSAGSWESWRPDAARFPKPLLGRSLDGWPGERWVDVRDVQHGGSVLRSLLDARLDLCHRKGFDLVELDNVDGYQNASGFALRAADQLFFNAVLANDAHRRHLGVLQKNDLDQVPTLKRYFDGALDEQCNQYAECAALNAYVAMGKPVFNAEYARATSSFCAADNKRDFNGVRLALALDDSRFQPCR